MKAAGVGSVGLIDEDEDVLAIIEDREGRALLELQNHPDTSRLSRLIHGQVLRLACSGNLVTKFL